MSAPFSHDLAAAMALIDVSPSIPAVLIGEPHLLADAREALASIGARAVSELGWADITAGSVLPAVRTLFVIEARGIDEAALAAALPRLAAAAEAFDSPVVIGLDSAMIDPIAAVLLGPRTQMLCEPGVTERSLAISLAAQMFEPGGLTDTAYEGEAARLQRLNEEVARIAEVLSRLSRRESIDQRRGPAALMDRHQSFAAQPLADVAIEPGEIRRAIRARRLRDQFFGAGLFEEPGWDMVLDLFAAELEQARVSVSSLCIAAAVAPTTALRWISKLTEAGLFERHPDPFDRRRAYMELSERASRAMRDYIGAMRRAGLSLA